MEETHNQYLLSNQVSPDECKTIEQRIKEENRKNGNHMLEKTAQALFKQSITQWCCIARCKEELIGCILMMSVQEDEIKLFERWSLLVKPWYRWLWIGYKLIRNILDIYKDLPIYSVTNVPAVITMNEHLHQHWYTKDMIPQKILRIMEMPWALLHNDMVYSNEILHTLIQTHAQPYPEAH